MLQTKVVEKIETHLTFNILFSFENCVVNEVIWRGGGNIVEPGRPQMTIWCMRIACWIPKSTNIHSDYVTCISFALQQWLYEPTAMLCYM